MGVRGIRTLVLHIKETRECHRSAKNYKALGTSWDKELTTENGKGLMFPTNIYMI